MSNENPEDLLTTEEDTGHGTPGPVPAPTQLDEVSALTSASQWPLLAGLSEEMISFSIRESQIIFDNTRAIMGSQAHLYDEPWISRIKSHGGSDLSLNSPRSSTMEIKSHSPRLSDSKLNPKANRIPEIVTSDSPRASEVEVRSESPAPSDIVLVSNSQNGVSSESPSKIKVKSISPPLSTEEVKSKSLQVSSEKVKFGSTQVSTQEVNSGSPQVSAQEVNFGSTQVSALEVNFGSTQVSALEIKSKSPQVSTKEINFGSPQVSTLEIKSKSPQVSSQEVNLGSPQVSAAQEVNFGSPQVSALEIKSKSPQVSTQEINFGSPQVSALEIKSKSPQVSCREVNLGSPQVSAAQEVNFGSPQVSALQIKSKSPQVSTQEINFGSPQVSAQEVNFRSPQVSALEIKSKSPQVSTQEINFGSPQVSAQAVNFGSPQVSAMEIKSKSPQVSAQEVKSPQVSEIFVNSKSPPISVTEVKFISASELNVRPSTTPSSMTEVKLKPLRLSELEVKSKSPKISELFMSSKSPQSSEMAVESKWIQFQVKSRRASDESGTESQAEVKLEASETENSDCDADDEAEDGSGGSVAMAEFGVSRAELEVNVSSVGVSDVSVPGIDSMRESQVDFYESESSDPESLEVNVPRVSAAEVDALEAEVKVPSEADDSETQARGSKSEVIMNRTPRPSKMAVKVSSVRGSDMSVPGIDTKRESQVDFYESETSEESQEGIGVKANSAPASETEVKLKTPCMSQAEVKAQTSRVSQTELKAKTSRLSQTEVNVKSPPASKTDVTTPTVSETEVRVVPVQASEVDLAPPLGSQESFEFLLSAALEESRASAISLGSRRSSTQYDDCVPWDTTAGTELEIRARMSGPTTRLVHLPFRQRPGHALLSLPSSGLVRRFLIPKNPLYYVSFHVMNPTARMVTYKVEPSNVVNWRMHQNSVDLLLPGQSKDVFAYTESDYPLAFNDIRQDSFQVMATTVIYQFPPPDGKFSAMEDAMNFWDGFPNEVCPFAEEHLLSDLKPADPKWHDEKSGAERILDLCRPTPWWLPDRLARRVSGQCLRKMALEPETGDPADVFLRDRLRTCARNNELMELEGNRLCNQLLGSLICVLVFIVGTYLYLRHPAEYVEDYLEPPAEPEPETNSFWRLLDWINQFFYYK